MSRALTAARGATSDRRWLRRGRADVEQLAADVSGVVDFYATLKRLVREKIAPGAAQRSAWDVCEELLPSLPPRFVARLAVEAMVDAYFKGVDEDTKPVKKPAQSPTKVSKQRARYASNAIREVDDPAISERMWASINRAVSIFREECRVEWTAELLAETFALPDGTVATWADATTEQHLAASVTDQVQATHALATAARHQQAVEAIQAAGAHTLAEAVAKVAA